MKSSAIQGGKRTASSKIGSFSELEVKAVKQLLPRENFCVVYCCFGDSVLFFHSFRISVENELGMGVGGREGGG